MFKNKITVNAITVNYKSISNVITSPVIIQNTFSGIKEKTFGIWDTGATGSAIAKPLATKLGLVPVGKVRVFGVHGYKDDINVYGIRVILHEKRISFILPVTECERLSDDDSSMFLIGMDVISKGDFAITNFRDRTVMTFRVPSKQKLDFVK